MLRRNVLIFHSGALGDFILTWPLALALGRLYPQSRIIYVTAAQKGALAAKALRLESTDVEQGWHHLFGNPISLPEPARKRLEGAHTIFTFVASPGDAWTKSVRQINPEADCVPLPPKPPDRWSSHATEFLTESLSARPVVQTAVRQLLASIATQGVGPRSTGNGILIHPGSGSPDKCWPLENYLALIDRLHKSANPVRVVLGEVERERFSPNQLSSLESAAPVVWPKTCVDLLAEMQKSARFLGNDTGPTHLAGIIGLDTTAIFGPTDPAVWRPLGPKVRVLVGSPLATLDVETVYDYLMIDGPRA